MKSKLTVTVESEILKELDSFVDGVKVRSRSQAVQVLLKQALAEKSVKNAVIFLFAKDKIYLKQKVKGKPLLQHTLEILEEAGVKNLFIINQHKEQIGGISEETVKSRVKVFAFERPKCHQSADMLLEVKKHVRDGNFIIMNGDTYHDIDLREMIKAHFESNKVATIGLANSDIAHVYTTVTLDGDDVVELYERIRSPSNVIYAGISILKPEIFDFYDKNTVHLETQIFPKLAKIRQIKGFFTHKEFIHLPEQYQEEYRKYKKRAKK